MIYTQEVDIRNPIIRQSIFIAFRGKCFYTGRSIDMQDMHIDHIIPQILGGKNTLDNLVLCCQEINLKKGDKYSDSFGKVMTEIVKLVFLPEVIKTIKEMECNAQLNNMSCLNDRLREKGINPYSLLGGKIRGRITQRKKCKLPNMRRGKKRFFLNNDIDTVIEKVIQAEK